MLHFDAISNCTWTFHGNPHQLHYKSKNPFLQEKKEPARDFTSFLLISISIPVDRRHYQFSIFNFPRWNRGIYCLFDIPAYPAVAAAKAIKIELNRVNTVGWTSLFLTQTTFPLFYPQSSLQKLNLSRTSADIEIPREIRFTESRDEEEVIHVLNLVVAPERTGPLIGSGSCARTNLLVLLFILSLQSGRSVGLSRPVALWVWVTLGYMLFS